MSEERRKLLFVINHSAGRKTPDWESVIVEYFKSLPFEVRFYTLPEKFEVATIQSQIDLHKPDVVIAVGGDGTTNLLATCVKNTNGALGILPAGSANGMAKELRIGDDVQNALKIIAEGSRKRISLVELNGRVSIHLSDIGLNAYMLREFERRGTRGLIGYLLATAKVLGNRRAVHVDVHYNNEVRTVRADIILIANATMYGTGVVVNPMGKLDDDVFEIIAIKDLTLKDLLNTSLHTQRLDVSKAEIIQTSKAEIYCRKPVHFQVDGEYLGKVHEIKIRLLPNCLDVIVPMSEPG